MNARSFVLIAVLAAACAWWLTRPKPRAKIAEPEIQSEVKSQATSAPQAVAVQTPSPLPARATQANASYTTPKPTWKPLVDDTPSLATITEETEKNPHETSQSLLDFSSKLGRMVDSVHTPDEGSELFMELVKCVTEPKDAGAHSVQAVCLVNARELSEKFPQFKYNYEVWSKKAHPKVLDLIKDLP
ncbi:MAG: hypothetical protein ABL958_12145 [Bdellovibrionia bacterium]